MDGLLVIDKPVGPTSHDVVARVRRALRERRIGHTGTLDPLASGVLPLVLGRATRLARFLTSDRKRYDAVIRLGFATDTGDREGTPITLAYDASWPALKDIEHALDRFRGTFMQQPPAYSAKKIGGVRSYQLARTRADGQTGPAPSPVQVNASLRLLRVEGSAVTVDVDCSAGFYVRSLAHDLGAALGTAAHLEALRRTASGDLTLADAVALDVVENSPAVAAAALVPLRLMLPGMSALTLSDEGVKRACQGRDLGPADFVRTAAPLGEPGTAPLQRLLDGAGNLVALGEPSRTHGLLHPAVVLV